MCTFFFSIPYLPPFPLCYVCVHILSRPISSLYSYISYRFNSCLPNLFFYSSIITIFPILACFRNIFYSRSLLPPFFSYIQYKTPFFLSFFVTPIILSRSISFFLNVSSISFSYLSSATLLLSSSSCLPLSTSCSWRCLSLASFLDKRRKKLNNFPCFRHLS
jgi:hypothetical protein